MHMTLKSVWKWHSVLKFLSELDLTASWEADVKGSLGLEWKQTYCFSHLESESTDKFQWGSQEIIMSIFKIYLLWKPANGRRNIANVRFV